MARLPRIGLSGIPKHIIQRGNNRQACFAADADFIAYAHWLDEYARKYRVAIHAWVFMTNHVHLLATPKTSCGKADSSLVSWTKRTICLCASAILNSTPSGPIGCPSPVNTAGQVTGLMDRARPRGCGRRTASIVNSEPAYWSARGRPGVVSWASG